MCVLSRVAVCFVTRHVPGRGERSGATRKRERGDRCVRLGQGAEGEGCVCVRHLTGRDATSVRKPAHEGGQTSAFTTMRTFHRNTNLGAAHVHARPFGEKKN